MSAYDIKAFMERSTTHFWKEHEAQLYPTLKQLQKNKYVGSKEEKAKKSGVRKIYQITENGLSVLTDWLMQPPDKITYRNEFLLKLFFGDQVDKTVSFKHINAYKKELSEQLIIFNSIQSELKNFKNLKRKPYVELALLYGIMLLEAEISWCDKASHILKKAK